MCTMVSPTPHQTNPQVVHRFRDDRRSPRARAADSKPDASHVAQGSSDILRHTLAIVRDRRDRHSALPTFTDPPKKSP